MEAKEEGEKIQNASTTADMFEKVEQLCKMLRMAMDEKLEENDRHQAMACTESLLLRISHQTSLSSFLLNY